MSVIEIVAEATSRTRRVTWAWMSWLEEATDPAMFSVWQP